MIKAKGAAGASRAIATPYRCRLVIMAKLPVMGSVKTRLGKAIGPVEATQFYRHVLSSVSGRLAADRRWQTELSIAPATATSAPIWPRGCHRRPQTGGDLGRRMQAIFERNQPGPVIIVGTDIPGITPRHIAEAFRLVRRGDAVLGPAPDGGYWLVGLRRTPGRLRPFAHVRWSSPHTLTDTLSNLRGREVAIAARLSDVDDEASYRACRGWSGRRVLPAAAVAPCMQTFAENYCNIE